jgi:hypothetical protein
MPDVARAPLRLFLTDRKAAPVFASGPLERLASLGCVRPFRPVPHEAAIGAAPARTLLWSPVAACAAAAQLRASWRRYSGRVLMQCIRRGLLWLQGRHCLFRCGAERAACLLTVRAAGQLKRIKLVSSRGCERCAAGFSAASFVSP